MTFYLRHYIMAEDGRREKVLREMGLRVIRFQNDEVRRDLSTVVGKIGEQVLVKQK